MLLVIGYDIGSIERMRTKLRHAGFPSFGCTCRQISDFPWMEQVTGVFFPAPMSLSRTEYAISPIREQYPKLPILAFTQPGFPKEDALQSPSLTGFASPYVRDRNLFPFLLTYSALYPSFARYDCIFRHSANKLPFIHGRAIALTPGENTLLACLLLYGDQPIPIALLRAACFSLVSPPQDNGVSAAIHRLNKKLAKRLGRDAIRFFHEKGYALDP